MNGEFLAAVNGKLGDLTAWLKQRDENEIREAITSLCCLKDAQATRFETRIKNLEDLSAGIGVYIGQLERRIDDRIDHVENGTQP